LVVGGHHDGEWHDVDTGREHLELLVLPTMTTPEAFSFAAQQGVISKALYKRQQWRNGDRIRHIYHAVEISQDAVLGMLLDGYRRPRSRKV
jgi:hypothetical protein